LQPLQTSGVPEQVRQLAVVHSLTQVNVEGFKLYPVAH